MKLAVAFAVALAAIGGLSAVAAADDLNGNYDLKLVDNGSSCSTPPVTMRSATLRIEVKQGTLRANIPTIPQMTGVAKGDAVDAKTTKVAPSTVQGLDATYALAGKLQDGMLALSLEADYSVKGKPYCTQSWKVTGVRQKP
jgi:hypothetical protein|nr:hypothetical protein [Kofleriaceae bacterium]